MFEDFIKAYDSIGRQSLIEILEDQEKTLRFIKQTLTDTTPKVKFIGKISEPDKEPDYHQFSSGDEGIGKRTENFKILKTYTVRKGQRLSGNIIPGFCRRHFNTFRLCKHINQTDISHK